MPIGYLAAPAEQICPQCNKTFVAKTRRKYCSEFCTRKMVKIKMFGQNDISRTNPVNGSPIGAAAEMLVCFDLLRHGLEPYTPVNGHASHDVLCGTKSGDRLWRIAVKRGYLIRPKVKTGEKRVAFGGMCHTVHKDTDILAIAITSDAPSIFYFKPKRGAIYLVNNQVTPWESQVTH